MLGNVFLRVHQQLSTDGGLFRIVSIFAKQMSVFLVGAEQKMGGRGKDTVNGFVSMNEALKKRVENKFN